MPFEIKANKLCGDDPNRPFKIECWDDESSGKHQFIGEVQVTVAALTSDKPPFLQLVNPKKSKPGKLIPEAITKLQKPEFLDYIRGGTQINMIIAVDFTASNGTPTNPSSLHAIKPGSYNSYQEAIFRVSEILLNYDYDKKVPMFGFGARPRFPGGLNTSETLHCFSLTGDPASPEVQGLDGIMSCYINALNKVELNGPTYFGPILQEASNLALNFKKSTLDVYTVMLIMTDGAIHDVQKTIDSLVGGAYLPLSVIIIGVGDADF
jgi:hypothetical protein